MDIMMPDGQSRIPVIQRNAGGRQFKTAAELNAYITNLNASGGIDGVRLPLVSDTARFNDSFNSVDVRVSRPFSVSERFRVEPMIEVFNLFNTTNILGVTNLNYSGMPTCWFVTPKTLPILGTSTRRNSVGPSPRLAACSDPEVHARCSWRCG